MMSAKIDKGLPLPPEWRKYPWDECKVGDSFTVPFDCHGHALANQRNGRNERKGFPERYKARVVHEGVKRYRIWRVK